MLFSAAFFAELLLSLQDLVLTPFIRSPPKTWPSPLAPTSQQVIAFHFITWIMLPHSCLSLILIYRLVVSTAGTELLSSLKSLRKKKTQYVHVGYSVNVCWGKEWENDIVQPMAHEHNGQIFPVIGFTLWLLAGSRRHSLFRYCLCVKYGLSGSFPSMNLIVLTSENSLANVPFSEPVSPSNKAVLQVDSLVSSFPWRNAPSGQFRHSWDFPGASKPGLRCHSSCLQCFLTTACASPARLAKDFTGPNAKWICGIPCPNTIKEFIMATVQQKVKHRCLLSIRPCALTWFSCAGSWTSAIHPSPSRSHMSEVKVGTYQFFRKMN